MEGLGFKLFGTMIEIEERRGMKEDINIEITSSTTEVVALQCPRCKSKDTKFCYFNNYSINQPRHYCRACRRYWTAGGSLRDVPVGAGRRRRPRPELVGFSAIPNWLLWQCHPSKRPCMHE
ncbi:hypothetical protein J5N97_004377 [Dioscorea zingiberensis]|uniref:Dof-type domain-containing protein n=1 Tax=Dioscorea zingiberensis TaxID=325984 RepID=A0A9D5D6F8_9LILI|nr:hypothetical protein J5N97_004377 [Dioscorea zingiberensis]